MTVTELVHSSTVTPQVWAVPRMGSLANLVKQPANLAVQSPPGTVRVAVRAIGLNFADVFCVLGLYAAFGASGNPVPGLEFAGVVEADGEGLKKGDRVYGTTRFGAYTTHLDADPRYLRSIPESWSFEQAAAYPVQTITAYYALHHLGVLQPSATVLLQSAAGGVGLQALRILAATPDVKVLGIVGNPKKIDLLTKMFPGQKGWRFVSREADTSLGEQIKSFLSAQQSSGFDLILDSVMGPAFQPSYDALNPCGRYVIFGSASLAPSTISLSPMTVGFYNPMNFFRMITLAYKFLTRPKIDPLVLVADNKNIMGYNLIWLYDKLQLLTDMYSDLNKLNLEPPHVGHVFTFDDLPKALAYFQTGQTVGKVVVTVP